MRVIISFLVGGLLLAFMSWLGKEGYRSAKAYEKVVKESASMMTPQNLAELQIKDFASKLTFGFIKNDIKQKVQKLQHKQKTLKHKTILFAKKYAVVAIV